MVRAALDGYAGTSVASAGSGTGDGRGRCAGPTGDYAASRGLRGSHACSSVASITGTGRG
jgi:hypothetical protein